MNCQIAAVPQAIPDSQSAPNLQQYWAARSNFQRLQLGWLRGNQEPVWLVGRNLQIKCILTFPLFLHSMSGKRFFKLI